MFLKIFKLLFGKKSLKQKDQISKKIYEEWQTEKEILQRYQTIQEEKLDLKEKLHKKKNSFGKALMIFLFINFTVLELFTGWVTLKSFTLGYATNSMPDFTPLITLLGAVLGETISYAIYANKAKAENTQGGLIYEMAMRKYEDDQPVG